MVPFFGSAFRLLLLPPSRCAWSAVTTFGPTTHGHFTDKLLHQKFAWRRSGTLGYIRPTRQRDGGHALKWEAELASPNDDGFDLKWKWEAKSKPCAAGKVETKWGAEEANKDDNNPARKCVQIKEISTGCDVQIEAPSRQGALPI
ncbi:uncharacterized protein [Triticum aestivum]|uniref:uncharacterized protein n=1 Tax=Triticum aestivum TaxID=4565 RepID=UPI001D005D61|nr:uncharacterized protein LOC123175514 [Triticum aestivum]XP_044446247.1 uncharacterized protein LOC123175787 [Triticum aestivum]